MIKVYSKKTKEYLGTFSSLFIVMKRFNLSRIEWELYE